MAVEIISPFWGLQNIARSVLYINVSVSGLKSPKGNVIKLRVFKKLLELILTDYSLAKACCIFFALPRL
jgi:hypothetical protein